MDTAFLTRLAHFVVAYRASRLDWSDAHTRDVSGARSNPRRHGHNFGPDFNVQAR